MIFDLALILSSSGAGNKRLCFTLKTECSSLQKVLIGIGLQETMQRDGNGIVGMCVAITNKTKQNNSPDQIVILLAGYITDMVDMQFESHMETRSFKRFPREHENGLIQLVRIRRVTSLFFPLFFMHVTLKTKWT